MLLSVLLASAGCAWLDERQRQIIYRPTPSGATEPAGFRPGDLQLFLPVQDTPAPQRLELWWLPHPDPAAPTLLYLHGTFRNLAGNRHKIESLRDAGFAVLAPDYRGWGQSSAMTPSEQSILADTRLAWSELQRRQPDPHRRVIYGHSMGSGAAVDLASGLTAPGDYAGLILESAFTSFADVARKAGFWASLLVLLNNERFASIDKITRVQAPLLMLHGQLDDTIPIQLGQRLFAAANEPKQWLDIAQGQHSDLNLVARDRYLAALTAFRARYLPRP